MLLYPVLLIATSLDEYTNKAIELRFSSYPDHVLAVDLANFGDYPFLVFNNQIPNKRYDSTVRINRNGQFYSIKIGGTYICPANGRVKRCNIETPLWNIEILDIYMKVKSNDLCLSVQEEHLTLADCDDIGDQNLTFTKLPQIYECLKRLERHIGNMPIQIKAKKIQKFLQNIEEKLPPSMIDEIRPDTDEPFDKIIKKTVPNIEDTPKVKKILDKVHKNSYKWKFPGVSMPSWFNLYCPL